MEDNPVLISSFSKSYKNPVFVDGEVPLWLMVTEETLYKWVIISTIWLFNIAMENHHF